MLPKLKRRFFSRPRLVRAVAISALLILIVFLSVLILSPTLRATKRLLIPPASLPLKNDGGRINVLILGIGGDGHDDGSYLTDTMIVASLKTATPSVTLISIPRDIYLESLQQKINAAYEIGLKRGAGLALAKESATQVTGLPIHYTIRFDFTVFEKIIDILGGVDINVPATLDDYSYPIDGQEQNSCGISPIPIIVDELSVAKTFPCRFELLHFDAGPTHMDGKTALKFVRSRHAQGEEGTDFARSRRQQLVMKAIKGKVFSDQAFLNPAKDLAIYNELQGHIDTDFDTNQSVNLFNLARKFRNVEFTSIVIDLSLLENPPIDDRGWILLPKNDNWEEIHKFISDQLEKK